MTKEAAELLTKYDGEIYEGYSGKGMYGQQTTGVVFETESDFYKAIADAISDEMYGGNKNNGQELCSALRHLKTDNLGLRIIYY